MKKLIIRVPAFFLSKELNNPYSKTSLASDISGLQIEILVLNTNSGKTKLIVSDNGVGFPEGFCLEDSESIGLKVVSLLVESQLEGTVRLDKGDGAKFEIVF